MKTKILKLIPSIVFKMSSDGMTNKYISNEIGLSEHVVNNIVFDISTDQRVYTLEKLDIVKGINGIIKL